MKLPDISYKVLYHFKGYIRLEVSTINSSWPYFLIFFNNCAAHMPPGIEKFYFNPFTGNIVITYKPDDINIREYIIEWFRAGILNISSKDECYEMPASH
jgi:hypothetical protein